MRERRPSKAGRFRQQGSFVALGAGCLCSLLAAALAFGATGALTPKDCIDDEVPGGPDNCPEEAKGLNGAASVAVSPDGKSVYAASRNDDAIVRFKRNTRNGKLTPKGCVDDNDSGADDCAEDTNGLDSATSVVLSPDGKSLYAASLVDSAIVRFKRNTRNGKLTPKGCVDDNDSGADTCGQDTNGLDGAISVAVSPDGKSLYAASQFDDAIVRFKRER